ncbi:acyl-CoA-binding protein [Deltaproteobacteria bacterium TL4]
MSLQEEFESAKVRSEKLPKRPSNDQLLQMYALYKQSVAGDASGARPGFADFQGRAKYDSWAKVKGKTQDEAKKEYVALVSKLEKDMA